MVLWMAERAPPDDGSRAPGQRSSMAAVDLARYRFIRWRPLPGTAGRVGRGFRTVPGHRQDSYVCRRPGRSSERRDPAWTYRPGRRTSGLPEILVRLPHPLPRGEGALGLWPGPVDGAEPRV